MKTRYLFTIYLVFTLISTLFFSISYAADSTQLNLPEEAKFRLGKGIYGAGTISKIKFSPDGSRIAVLSSIGIWIFNAHSLEEMSLIPIQAISIAFSPDGLKIAIGNWWTIEILNIETGNKLHELSRHGWILTSFSFSPNGQTIASASADKTIRLREADTGKDIHTIKGHSDEVKCVVFSPDGKFLASSGDDNSIRLWSTETGEQKQIVTVNAKSITELVFSSDGKDIISINHHDRMLQMWDTNTGKLKHAFTPKEHAVNGAPIAFSPDRRTIAMAEEDESIRLYDTITGQQRQNLKGQVKSIVGLDFSPDGKTIASVNNDNTIQLWNAETGKLLHVLTDDWHTDNVTSVVFSPDGKTIATGSDDKTIMLWDAGNWDPQTYTSWAYE